MDVDTLNKTFGLGDNVRFAAGEGGLVKAVVRLTTGEYLEVYSLGAHITCFGKPELGELLFLSKTAKFRVGTAIRGGIPIVFPQFGGGELPSHGFARSSLWTFSAVERSGNDIILKLTLESSDETLKAWPHRFRAEYQITVSSTLRIRFSVTNTNDTGAFAYQCAFHSYFEIGEIAGAGVLGLEDTVFLDNVKARQVGHEAHERLKFDGEIDRIYLNARPKLRIESDQLRRAIILESIGLPDAVVWNPWEERERTFSDLEPGSHRRFLCVESGAIGAPIRIGAGETTVCEFTVSASKL